MLRTDSKRVVLNCTRQWGKSTVTAVKAVHRAMFEDESLTLVLSPSERQSALLVRKAAQFMRRLGLKTRGDGQNGVSVVFPNGSRIVGLPGNERFLRGFSAVSLLVVDEASRVEDELYRSMRPMLAVSDGDIWLMSTPAGRLSVVFWRAWDTGDGESWVRLKVPATECPRIRPSFLETERKVQGERKFRQEYLCEFVQDNEALFSEDLLRSLIVTVDPPAFGRTEWWK